MRERTGAARDLNAAAPVAAIRPAATSQDVARLAGVSKTAVSLVLNGQADRHGLSSATQARVQMAARSLGYTPNHAARSLRRQRSFTITFMTADLGNRYVAEAVTAAGDAARARGYLINVVSARDAAAEAEAIERICGGVSDGLVVYGGSTQTHEHVSRLRSRGIACVLLQDASPDRDVPCVSVDITEGGRLATAHLLALGHRIVAHVTDRRLAERASNNRLDGYRQALQAAGVAFDPDLVVGAENSFAGGDAAMRELMTRDGPRPTAVFVFNDQMAIGGLHALAALGLRVPDDVAIVGFDGTELGAFSVPELTTVDHPRGELGRWAATSVLDQIDGLPVPGLRVLPVRLVVRNSCGAGAAK
jgi:DNA-binding LacI/PurR family transcriptional regulator